MWEDGLAPGLLLADLCGRCATQADALLQLYGGYGREDITLLQEIRASPAPRAAQSRGWPYAARGALYLLIAIGSFLLVTAAASGGH